MPSGVGACRARPADPREGRYRVPPIGDERSFTSARASARRSRSGGGDCLKEAVTFDGRGTGSVRELVEARDQRGGVGLLDCHLAEIALAYLGAPQREDEPCGQAFRFWRRNPRLLLVVGEHMADDAESKVDELHRHHRPRYGGASDSTSRGMR